MAITDKEIQDYWIDYDWFIIRWFCVSFFGFPLLPLAYIGKYWLGIKGIWLLNDTKDGDFGDPVELEKANREEGKTLGNFIWWWFRNHSWNYNRKFIPEWNAGQAEEFRVISSTVIDDNDFKEMKEALMWTWCSKEGFHGHHYIAARINGKVEVRFSEANDKFQRQMGSGGNEYRFRFKGLFTIFTKQLKRLFK